MNEVDLVRLVDHHRVFAEIKAPSADTALRSAEAALTGGIRLIQVPLTTPGGFRVISELRRSYGDRACVGASSVVAYDQIDRAIKSGAQFIAMPHTVAALVELCRDARVSPIVGALTPTEVAEAAALAVPLVTVFPADSLGGPAYVSQLTSRFPEIRIAAASGVSAENIVDYFAGGVVAVVVGSRLFTQVEVQNGRYPAIAERARGLLRLAGVG